MGLICCCRKQGVLHTSLTWHVASHYLLGRDALRKRLLVDLLGVVTEVSCWSDTDQFTYALKASIYGREAQKVPLQRCCDKRLSPL